ncbi:immunity 22 family protein [Paenibacillus sp. GCM10012306]|uniref:immunity 22 family protein n=1 Tax=Paenibacillus sp. GCM10012306 TaxID=3317342 RepID=UPI00361124B4
MRNAVAIWAGNFNSEEELMTYTEGSSGDGVAGGSFMDEAGLEGLDQDFMERHYIGNGEERRSLVTYLRLEYTEYSEFAEQLPADLEARLVPYNSVVLLYGNDSPYGPVNEMLLESFSSKNTSASFPMILIARVEYETLGK